MQRQLMFLGASITVAATVVLAQVPGSSSFEVASIKPNTTGPRGIANVLLAGGRYVGSGATVRSMISFAWQPLLSRQIVGGPAWIDSERFDVIAKAEGNPSGDRLRQMLRTLLEDRFTLRTHMEKRDTNVFALVKVRSDGRLGPQLKPGSVDCSDRRGDQSPADAEPPQLPPIECGFRIMTRNIVGVGIQIVQTGKGISMEQLVAQLSPIGLVGRVVVDRTELSATYDVELTFSAGGVAVNGVQQQDPGPAGASIFTALQEQLGLKLESTNAPVDFLVIDSVEHPTSN